MAEAPISLNLKSVRGDSYKKDPFYTVNSEIDPTGATAQMELRRPNGKFIYSFSPTVTVDDGSLIVSLDEPPLNISSGEYLWDLQINYADGQVHTWVGGKFTILKDVTL